MLRTLCAESSDACMSINTVPTTPFEKRKQLASVFMTLMFAEFPQLEPHLNGIERQHFDSYLQSLLVQYGEYINSIVGIKRD